MRGGGTDRTKIMCGEEGKWTSQNAFGGIENGPRKKLYEGRGNKPHKKYWGDGTRTAQKVVWGERERTAQELFDGRGIDRAKSI